MSKKQSMNFFEAHLEKMLLGVAAAVFIWVVASQYLSSPGINAPEGTLPASEALPKAASQAKMVVDRARTDGTVEAPQVSLAYSKELFAGKPLTVSGPDRYPLYAGSSGGNPEMEHAKYHVPDVPKLANVQIELTNTQAWVPEPPAAGADPTMAVAAPTQRLRDVTYVTMEASFTLKDFRQAYDEAFGKGAKSPLPNGEVPIVACVDLEHARLLPDGSWSEWQSAGRLTSDSLYSKYLPFQEIEKRSQTEFEVMMDQWKDINWQLSMLRPAGYTTANNQQWTPPSVRNPGTTRGSRPTAVNPAAPMAPAMPAAPAGGQPGMMPGMMGPGMMPGMMGPGMGPGMMPGMMGPGMMPGGAGAGTASSAASFDQSALNSDKVNFWAHDNQIEPGGIYRFRLRLGFFNPIAGKKWAQAGQEQFNTQRILWTPFITPDQDKVVAVPERTYFFPKQAGGPTGQARISVEVYRWQEGQWNTKTYPAVPGAVIGGVDKRPLSAIKPGYVNPNAATLTGTGTAAPDMVELDYRTNVTVLDVIPNCTYQALQRGGAVENVPTTDLVFMDKEGQIKRLGVDRRTWPEDLSSTYSRISREYLDQNKRRTAGTTPGTTPGT